MITLPSLGRFALQIAGRATVESFFKSLKAEMIWRRNWQTRREVEVAIFEYIKGFYNPHRRHSALGWKSPVAFERKAA
jgi:transposase InsO family protein